MGEDSIDPLDERDVEAFQEQALDSWGGQLLSASVDLGASFVSIPGLGAASKLRKSSGINTMADAEGVAKRFAEAPEAGRTGTQKAKDAAVRLAFPDGKQNLDALVERQVKGLRELDGIHSQSTMLNRLKARMPLADEGSIAAIANQFTEINKVADPAARDRLRMNTFLGALGSTTAKKAMIADAPLLARNFENLAKNPREAGVFTDLYTARIHEGDELGVSEIVEERYKTEADKAEIKALAARAKTLGQAKRDSVRLEAEIKQAQEAFRVAARQDILDQRANRVGDAQKAREQRDIALADYEEARKHARDATKAGREFDRQGMNDVIGARRVALEEAESRLALAREDRALMDETPLDDVDILEGWEQQIGTERLARTGLGEAMRATRAKRAELRTSLDAKKAELTTLRPLIDKANTRISEILDIAGTDSTMALVGDAKPTALNRLKAHVREQIGSEHYVTAGQGNAILRVRSLPSVKARQMLAPAARGQIALREINLGQQQLADTLARSKVYTAAEIGAARNSLIGASEADRPSMVARIQEEMVTRMAVRHLGQTFPDRSPGELRDIASEISSFTTKEFGKGNANVSLAADESMDARLATVRGPDGEAVAYDRATLRSQLADNAPMLDPWDVERMMRDHVGGFARNVRQGLHVLQDMHDFGVSAWKIGSLLRPGLAVRSQLDSGARTLASLSAAESLITMMNGAVNVTRNRGLGALAKVHFAGLDPAQVAATQRAIGLQTVRAGKGQYEFRFADDVEELRGALTAAQKGQSVSGSIFAQQMKAYKDVVVDRASWERRDPNSIHWAQGYAEYAKTLLASPSARKL
ncbi:MAG: hypothetical protein ACRCSN_04750, partial [Dermatophilaceae bacterium]